MKLYGLLISTITALAIHSQAQAAEGHYLHQGKPITFTYDPHISAKPKRDFTKREMLDDPFAQMGFATFTTTTAPKLLPVRFASGATGIVKNRVAVRFHKPIVNGMIHTFGKKHFTLEATDFNKHLSFVDTTSAQEAIEIANAWAQAPGVKYAHPMFYFPIEARAAADEPLFAQQWHLENAGQRGGTPGEDINIREAWSHTEGNARVAIIDLGFEQDHPDLIDAWLINEDEIPGNKRDDDQNGKVDDVRGWNFDIDGTNLIYGSVNKHGTAIAGLLAAPTNGIGVAGVCPGCKVLPMVIYNDIEHAIKAHYYAAERNVSVISNSWGYAIGVPETEVLEETLTDVAINGRQGRGISILFAMPNDDRNVCRSGYPDISAHPHVIAVSSVDYKGRKIEASGHGPCTKFVAPTSQSHVNALVTTDRTGESGYNVPGATFGDLPDGNYTQSFFGTSGATPIVAGIFALLYSLEPDLSADAALAIVMNTAEKIQPNDAQYNENGFSERYGYGRPDATKAVESLLATP